MLLLARQAHWGGGWWRCGHWRDWSHDSYSSRFERTPLLPVLKREVHAFSSPRLDYSWCTWSLPQCCNTLFKLLQNSLFSIANFQIWTHRTLPFSPSVDVCLYTEYIRYSDSFGRDLNPTWTCQTLKVTQPTFCIDWTHLPAFLPTQTTSGCIYFAFHTQQHCNTFSSAMIDLTWCMLCLILVIPWLKALWTPAACCIV